MIGATLNDKYRIVRELRRGTMGHVFEGVHTGMGRHVAIKVLTSGELTRDPVLIARFHREALATGALTSQHVVQILDSGADPATRALYLVMELLRGESTAELIRRRGKLPPQLALRIAAQACVGLANVHAARLVHRDVKPDNLFLSQRDAGEVVVKLAEFAVTKTLADQASEDTCGLTGAGSLLGTPAYMAPEAVEGRPDIDARADVWSLGVVLFEMLTGRSPFKKPTLAAQVAAVTQSPVPSVRDAAPEVPVEVAAIVERALQRDRDARWAGAAEMLEAIQPLLPAGTAIQDAELAGPEEPASAPHASSTPPLASSTPSPAPPTASSSSEAPAAPSTRRAPVAGRGRSAVTWVVALIALALAGVVVYEIAQPRSAPAGTAAPR